MKYEYIYPLDSIAMIGISDDIKEKFDTILFTSKILGIEEPIYRINTPISLPLNKQFEINQRRISLKYSHICHFDEVLVYWHRMYEDHHDYLLFRCNFDYTVAYPVDYIRMKGDGVWKQISVVKLNEEKLSLVLDDILQSL